MTRDNRRGPCTRCASRPWEFQVHNQWRDRAALQFCNPCITEVVLEWAKVFTEPRPPGEFCRSCRLFAFEAHGGLTSYDGVLVCFKCTRDLLRMWARRNQPGA